MLNIALKSIPLWLSGGVTEKMIRFSRETVLTSVPSIDTYLF